MVTKNQIKHITSLQQKKYRKQHHLFIAEGKKVIQELIDGGLNLVQIYTTAPNNWILDKRLIETVSLVELNKMSALSTANDSLAIFTIPEVPFENLGKITLVLDNIKDPGNLGTIIRLCDWFGIENLVCSEQTVDVYNPKVVQSTMGSLARVRIHYKNLTDFITSQNLPVLGTFMEGHDIYSENLPEQFLLVLGNEADGISETLSHLISRKVSIPRFGTLQKTESLNVATAAAIFLSEFCRKQQFSEK